METKLSDSHKIKRMRIRQEQNERIISWGSGNLGTISAAGIAACRTAGDAGWNFWTKDLCSRGKVMGSSGKCAVKEAQWNRLLPFLRGYITHEVKAGDTFFSIAKMYDTTMERVMHANPGTDAGALQIGSTVVVPLNFPLVSGEVPYTSLLTGWIIEGLQARYPYLQVGTIGRSVMGTPLWSLQLGNGPVEVGYNASFHANESITTPVLLKFVERLLEAYADERMYEELYPERLFEEYSLYLVPLVNPDGVDLVNGLLTEGFYYRRAVRIASGFPDIPFPDGWKANIQGVDLNLQFPAGWDMAKKIKFEQGITVRHRGITWDRHRSASRRVLPCLILRETMIFP